MDRLAVDIGGTFVDAIRFDRTEKRLVLQKASTTPSDPTVGVENAISKVDPTLSETEAFIHGTTLGLNAILEREGSKTGIITNEGFADVLEIGRYDRPYSEMFNPMYEKEEPLVPRHRRKGVSGRIGSDGEIVEPLDEQSTRKAISELIEEEGVDSIAVCLLHSYQNPVHEDRIAEIIEEEFPGINTSLSSALTREYREYERTSTAVMDAYIKPIFDAYIDELDYNLAEDGFDGSFFLTRSGGGALAADSAKQTPIHTVLSGPAGGIIGSSFIGKQTGHDHLIAADIGGTSTDTCVIQSGSPIIEHESEIGTHPVLIPAYDIRTIGSGGGSIAWLDGELLKVGPKSAGADPGPICYGKGGEEPTVTDAAVLLGYIDPDTFLGGEMNLDLKRAKSGVKAKLADKMDFTVSEACRGIFDVLTADIVNAIGEITVERGLDPREFSILAYGGAGPLIMPLVAREMDVESLLVPPAPSVFSAWGMLLADVVYDFSQTNLVSLDDTGIEEINAAFAPLEDRATQQLSEEGFARSERELVKSVEMRYVGQEHTVEVPTEGIKSHEELETAFQEHHQRRYGHKTNDPAEIVHLRVRAIGKTDKPDVIDAAEIESPGAESMPMETSQLPSRKAYCFADDAFREFEVRTRRSLSQSDIISGPAIIQEPTNTITVFSDQQAEIDEYYNVKITSEQ